jgi:hypothetical protein
MRGKPPLGNQQDVGTPGLLEHLRVSAVASATLRVGIGGKGGKRGKGYSIWAALGFDPRSAIGRIAWAKG